MNAGTIAKWLGVAMSCLLPCTLAKADPPQRDCCLVDILNNDGEDLQNALSRHEARCGQATLWVNQGNYSLSKTVYNPMGSLWLIPPSAGVVGGQLEGNTDSTAILPGHEGLALIALLKRPGGSGLFVSNAADGSTGYGPYEADGIYANVGTADPSTAADHDMVAGHFASTIDPGNSSGRVWGQDITVSIPSGADGYAVGQEIGVGNNSRTTGRYGEPNAKFGLSILASGTTDSTAAVLLHDAGARFLDGLLIFASGIRQAAFRLTTGTTDLAIIDADGMAKFTGLTVSGPVQLAIETLRTLPTICKAGQEVFVSDGRNPGEGAGNGSGTVAFCNMSRAWLATSTGHAVQN